MSSVAYRRSATATVAAAAAACFPRAAVDYGVSTTTLPRLLCLRSQTFVLCGEARAVPNSVRLRRADEFDRAPVRTSPRTEPRVTGF